MTQNPDNPEPTDEQLLVKVIRVVEDGASWGPRTYSEQNILTTLCANSHYDAERVKEAIERAEERGLISEMDGRYIPSGEYERYMRPGTIGSEVNP